MIDALAGAIMILAGRCLGTARGEWARAMQIEFEAAVPAGRRLPFAIGCLVAACREMPRHREGRLSIASHALALAFLVPMAAMLLLHASRIGRSAYVEGVVDSAGSRNPFLAGGQMAAAPCLLLLWGMLGAAHLCHAWVLLERDWPRVFNVSAMIVAGTATLACIERNAPVPTNVLHPCVPRPPSCSPRSPFSRPARRSRTRSWRR